MMQKEKRTMRTLASSKRLLMMALMMSGSMAMAATTIPAVCGEIYTSSKESGKNTPNSNSIFLIDKDTGATKSAVTINAGAVAAVALNPDKVFVYTEVSTKGEFSGSYDSISGSETVGSSAARLLGNGSAPDGTIYRPIVTSKAGQYTITFLISKAGDSKETADPKKLSVSPSFNPFTGDLAFGPDGFMYIYLANGSTSILYKLNPQDGSSSPPIAFGKNNGIGLAFDNDGYAYSTTAGGDSVYVYDVQGNSIANKTKSLGTFRSFDLASCTVPFKANNDTATTTTGTAVSIPVKDNDTGGSLPNGGSISVTFPGRSTSYTDPGKGVYVVNNDGTVTFTPADGYTGTSTVTYTDTLPSGMTSTATITVTVSAPPLACQSTAYGLYSTTSDPQYLTSLDILGYLDNQGNVKTIGTIPKDSRNTATLAVSKDGTKAFITYLNPLDSHNSYLKVYDVTSNTWGPGIAIPGTGTQRLYRMTTSSDGKTVYMGVQNKLWSFAVDNPSVISGPYTISFIAPSGYNPTPTLGDNSNDISGDFLSDSEGNLYLFASPPNTSIMYVFRVNMPNSNAPTADFIGQIKNIGATNSVFTGFAALPDGILGAAMDGTVLNVNISNYTVSNKFPKQDSRATTDLASCYYPKLNPVITSVKKVEKLVNGTPTALGENDTVKAGDKLQYTITTRNIGTLDANGVTLQDGIPDGTKYIINTTTLNGVAVADVNGDMPFVAAREIHGPSQRSGVLVVDSTPNVSTDNEATVVFTVEVKDQQLPTTIVNTGHLSYVVGKDGTTTVVTTPTNDVKVNKNVGIAPNIALTKYVRNTNRTNEKFNTVAGNGLPKDILQYCIAYSNTGGAANNFKLVDLFPTNTTYTDNADGSSSLLFITPAPDFPNLSSEPATQSSAMPSVTNTTTGTTVTANYTKGNYTQTYYKADNTVDHTATGDGVQLDYRTVSLPAGTSTNPSTGAICFKTKIN